MGKRVSKLIVVIFILSVFVISPSVSNAAVSARSLSGRILLEVESHGEAWYISPSDFKRYYLGRPDDAFNILRSFGLGISEADFSSVQRTVPSRLYGQILLRVQKSGEAYYVDPVSHQLYYLGRPLDAFNVLRSRGLGISEKDIVQISIGQTILNDNSNSHYNRNFTFEYKGNNYTVSLAMDETIYNYYKNLPKLVYYSGQESTSVRESFYALFLKTKDGDKTIANIANALRKIAADNNLNNNQLSELALAFVQSIPYDHDKAAQSSFTPNMPYETLYVDKGVCSEKVFLGVLIMRELGFGAAVLDFPESNHSALGIKCDTNQSTSSSGYCYGETTNRLPFAAVPPSLSGGQASTSNTWQNIRNASQLGRMEIYQKSDGTKYDPSNTIYLAGQIASKESSMEIAKADISAKEDALAVSEDLLSQKKSDVDYYYNQGDTYNYKAAVKEYNAMVVQFNADLAEYNQAIADYNAMVAEYNTQIKEFYWHL